MMDPAAADLDAIAWLLTTWARWAAPGDPTVRRLAEEAAYQIRRMGIAASIPGAELIARAQLNPPMARTDVPHEGDAARGRPL